MPSTLISNHISAGRDFICSAAGSVVCKALSATAFAEGGSYRLTYTTIVDEESLETAAFEAAAHLLQDWIPKSYEVRVTVVGTRVLATAIVAESERARIDWRSDYSNLRYEPVDVPPEIVAKLHTYLAAFSLAFGAFDFVVTPGGDWVMLECNPNGQWLWLHHIAHLPIPAALADLLTTEPAHHQSGWTNS